MQFCADIVVCTKTTRVMRFLIALPIQTEGIHQENTRECKVNFLAGAL